MQDRYGNNVTTVSPEAFDAYCAGVDLFLAAQAGGIEKLRTATALDPHFALAHADLARALQIVAQPKQAREHMALAEENLDAPRGEGAEQESEHIAIMGLLLSGKSAEAFERIKSHIRTYPRDVLTVQPCCGVFGLIGFSGRTDREQENHEFMAALHPHYIDDWWFESQYAFALCEIGELARAETLNEGAFKTRPDNANAAHHRAHIHYETGESERGRKQLNEWRAGYSRDGILHCHLAWHDALWALASNEEDRLWEIVNTDILPDVTTAPPINVMTDLVAVLLRAHLKGIAPPIGFWQTASAYAAKSFPKPGVSFADAHSAIAHTQFLSQKASDSAAGSDRLASLRRNAQSQLEGLQAPQRGWAQATVAAIAEAFDAFANSDWEACQQALSLAMNDHARLGGSRAQRDLLELTQAYVDIAQGQPPRSERVRRLLS